MRHNFSKSIINAIRMRAAFICSNPSCKKMTVGGAVNDEEKTVCLGVVSHIIAASPNGPRSDESVDPNYIKSIDNGIYLCTTCSHKIDKNNGIDYPTTLLHSWKKEHEQWVQENLNKSITEQSSSNIYYGASSSGQISGITANEVNFINPTRSINSVDVDRDFFQKINSFITRKFILEYNSKVEKGKVLKKHIQVLEEFLAVFVNPEDQFIDDEIESAREKLVSEIEQSIPTRSSDKLLLLIDCEDYYKITFREEEDTSIKRSGLRFLVHEILVFLQLKYDPERHAIPLPFIVRTPRSFMIRLERYDELRMLVKKKLYV